MTIPGTSRSSTRRVVRIALAGALCVSIFSGCISAWIDRSTGKYRDLRFDPQTRESVRARLGAPFASAPSGPALPFAIEIPEKAVDYDAYEVTGKIAHSDDGSSEMTLNAITLGAGEAIAIPLTLLSAAAESTSGKRILVFFYDAGGAKVDTSLYLPDGQLDFSF